jgi:drug/metabolite transporter (DMT)-like permease
VDAHLRTKTFLFAAFIVLSNAFGNLFLSLGMRAAGDGNLIVALAQPYAVLGILLLISWLLMRMAMLSWADLTYVLPVTALGYVVSAVLGEQFQNETIDAKRWGGIALIVAGVILVGLQDPHKEQRKS